MYKNNESKSKQKRQLKLFKILAFIFLVLTLVLLVALIVVLVMKTQPETNREAKVEKLLEERKKSQSESCSPKKSTASSSHRGNKVFSGLSPNETKKIIEFLFRQSDLQLTPAENATTNDNYIYTIEDYLPSKSSVLSYLDSSSRNSRQPVRKAKVILFMGKTKRVTEYLVPIDNPTRKEAVSTRRPLTWIARPICNVVETKEVATYLIGQLEEKVKLLIHSSFAPQCDEILQCLFFNIAPRTTLDQNSGERHLITWFFVSPTKVDDYYMYPVPFYVILAYGKTDGKLRIVKVYYNQKSFDSLSDLNDAYYRDSSIHYRLPNIEKNRMQYGSPTYTAQDSNLDKSRRPPEPFYPDGARFTVEGGNVDWLGWNFMVHPRTLTGLQLFDVKYNNERIAYELSMQDILVLYSGGPPDDYFKNYFDNGWSIGRQNQPLVRGVDCPQNAIYLNSSIYGVSSDEGKVLKDAMCVFEHRNSVPMRHHYSSDFFTWGYRYAFSMPDTVLVLRQILTVWNYDYIYDYEFHQNGVIEIKVSSTGYIAVSNNLDPSNIARGYVVNPEWRSVANLHQHVFNFKLDLDIAGKDNSFKTMNIVPEIQSSEFSNKDWNMMRLTETKLTNEKAAQLRYDFNNPRMYIMYNENKKQYNKADQANPPRGYRILSNSFSKVVLPDNSPLLAAGGSWTKYQLAVSRQKDEESTTASHFVQADPYKPEINFDDFFSNDESLVQQDLVAWVTVGLHHVPSYEDLPVTSTPGKTLTVTLSPFNYFKRDPSIHSRDAALFWNPNSNHTDSFLSKNATCLPVDKPPSLG